MAIYALTGLVGTLNGVDYSDHAKSFTITADSAQLDTTDFASAGWTEVIGGLKSGSFAINLMDDTADDDVDEELWALLGTVVPFTLKKETGAISASNPEYQGNCLVTQHAFGGAVGELGMKSLTFPTSGAITRDITA